MGINVDSIPSEPLKAAWFVHDLMHGELFIGQYDDRISMGNLREYAGVLFAAVKSLKADTSTTSAALWLLENVEVFYLEEDEEAHEMLGLIKNYLNSENINHATTNFEILFSGSSPNTFQNTEEEKNKIFSLTAEIREIVNTSKIFDDAHKNRLLHRISSVDIEVHKEKGNFDVILAGFVDIGDAFGTFGEKVKPIVDRYREIRSIAQKGAQEYEEIPAPEEQKRIPHHKDENED